MLAVITGLRAEQLAVDSHLEILDQSELPGSRLITHGTYNGKPVLTCRTGLGRDRTEGLLEELAGRYRVTAIVSARMARGINPRLRVGDLAFCPRTALRLEGESLSARQDSNLRLLEMAGLAATRARIEHVVGDCLTVWPLPEKPEPRSAFAAYDNLAVIDTDGYWLAEAALHHEIPYLSVRVSLGDGYQDVSRVVSWVGSRSFVSPWKVIRDNIGRPRRLRNFLRLGMAVRASSRSLACFFDHFLQQWDANPLLGSDRPR
jgi:hypothetical protein